MIPYLVTKSAHASPNWLLDNLESRRIESVGSCHASTLRSLGRNALVCPPLVILTAHRVGRAGGARRGEVWRNVGDWRVVD